MRDWAATRLTPWLVAVTLLLFPFAGQRSEAQAPPNASSGSSQGAVSPPEGRPGSSQAQKPGRETHGGLHIADLNSGITPQQLASSLVSGQAVTISNVTYTGSNL